ncbi:MAG: NADH-quinone oxidoreductase subunit H [Deltaproteobacteria bacterium]|jgi:NADH-quinone oxidoreductase subunit H|nr:NADH-quinone oxidoreductase subunit H [Deltaproteobacteria bacterium]
MCENVLEILKILIILAMLLGSVPFLVWMERKGAAYIQDRRGPNRATVLFTRFGGIFHGMADAIKLLSKEEVCPEGSYKPFYFAAPILALFLSLISVAVIPFAEPLKIGGCEFNLQIADLRSGLIYVLAISSFSAHAILYAGWGSNNKYSLIGGLRSSAQLISYEIPMALAAISIFMVAGSFRITDIVLDQGVVPLYWNIVRQPVAFVIFFVALMAESNRLPFDLPEAEAELVAGYHVEYSSMKFAMFFMAEYIHMFIAGLLIATLFLGGWQIPFINAELLKTSSYEIILFVVPLLGALLALLGALSIGSFKKCPTPFGKGDCGPIIAGSLLLIVGVVLIVGGFLAGMLDLPLWVSNVMLFLLQIVVLLIKAIFVCLLFIWIRWTLPRFRYDQMMRLGWRVLLPLGMINLIVTGAVIMYIKY